MLGSGSQASAGRSWLVAGLLVSGVTMAVAVYAARTGPIVGALPSHVVVTQPVAAVKPSRAAQPSSVTTVTVPVAPGSASTGSQEGGTDTSPTRSSDTSPTRSSDTSSGGGESPQPPEKTAGSGVPESRSVIQLVSPVMPVASYASGSASDASSSSPASSSSDGGSHPKASSSSSEGGDSNPQGSQQDH